MSFMNPKILNAFQLVYENSKYSTQRIVLDYELDFYLNFDRKMIINDTYYNIQRNSLAFRKPGQIVQSKGDYDCYILTLDFSDTKISDGYSRNKTSVMQPECDFELLKAIPAVFTPKHSDDIRHLFKKVISEFDKNKNSKAAQDLVMQLLLIIISDSYAVADIAVNHTSDFVSNICYYLSENYKEKINLDTLSRIFGYNKRYLSRKFQDEIGVSPIKYLINLRLDNAVYLLENTNHSIKEISYMCGYDDPMFFSSSFKQKFGCSPSLYRKCDSIQRVL